MSTILLKKKKEAESNRPASITVLYDLHNTTRLLYKGQVSSGSCKPSGFGVRYYSEGSSYKGSWSSGLREGYGVLVHQGGQIYDGDWKKGRKHGFGRQEYGQGGFYEGSWIRGRRHGWGRMVFGDGRVYEGSWRRGLFDGEGYLLQSDGRRLVGYWKKGILHGEGHYWIPGTRDILQGKWANGVFKRGSVLLSPTLEVRQADEGTLN